MNNEKLKETLQLVKNSVNDSSNDLFECNKIASNTNPVASIIIIDLLRDAKNLEHKIQSLQSALWGEK